MSGTPNDPNQQTPPWGATPTKPYAAQPSYGAPPQYPNAAQGFGYSQNPPQRPPQYGYAPPAGYPMYPMPGYAPAKPQSARAIASLVIGISNVVLGITAIIGAPVGLILGFLALKDTGPMGTRQGRGFAIGGIVLNSFGLLIVAGLIFIFAAALYTADANRGVANAAIVDQDMYVIGDKLRAYYYANKQSLGPGGPVQSTNSYRGTKVVGTLDLPDLVDDYDLSGNVHDFTLTITGKKSATVHHIRTGRELRITDISTRSESIYMGP